MDGMSHFRITYDGPALASHEMDARELAPALLAVGSLLESATWALHGDRVKPRVKVRGSFRTGSFGIDFTLATDWIVTIRDLFASEGASATANGLEILGALGFVWWAGKRSLLTVLRWLHGRRVRHLEATDTGAILSVDGETLEIEREVMLLLGNERVLQSLEAVTAPLERDGIDVLATGSDDTITETIRKEERAWFAPLPTESGQLFSNRIRSALYIESPTFKEGKKWRFSDGQASFSAEIADEEFLERVESGSARFGKGDILIVDIRIVQTRSGGKFRTERTIERVIDHRIPTEQRDWVT